MQVNNKKYKPWKYIQKCLRPLKIMWMVKSLRPVKIRWMVKSFRPVKIRRLEKSLQLVKIRRMVKSLRPVKIRRMAKSFFCQNPCAWWNISIHGNASGAGKVGGPLKNSLLFRLGRISNSWLLPGPADEHVLLFVDVLNLEHVVSKWRVSSRRSAFMGSLSPAPYWLFVPARHAQKWSKSLRQPKIRRSFGIPLISVKSQQSLSLLLGTLSKSRKNTRNHCLISAVTFMTSELEANLENQRMAS